MKAIFNKNNGNLIECQSNANNQTLINNAINSGFNIKDLEIRDITEIELEEIIANDAPLKYNPDTLITWAKDQVFAEALIPHFAAFLDFANKANQASYNNFIWYANAVGLTDTANEIVDKMIELGANITKGE